MKLINRKFLIICLSMLMPFLLALTFGRGGCNICYVNQNNFTDTEIFFERIYGVTINGHFQIIGTDTSCNLTRDTLIYSGSLNAINLDFFRAITCGSSGKILRSESTMNYTIWDNINSGTMEDLNDIDDFFSTIYIVGNAGTILKSTDDGETFSQLNSGTLLDLNEVKCLSYDSIRIAGDSLLSLLSTNGGDTWIRQSVYQSNEDAAGFRVDLKTLHFINFSTGWFAGQHYIFKTTNGGLSYSTRFKQEQQYDNYSNSIYFYNKDSGIVVGNRGDIQFTTDGGNNWFYSPDLQNITTNNLNKIMFDSETGFVAAAGDSGVIIHTDSLVLSIQSNTNQLSNGFNLSQNFPNPFNPETTIKYELTSGNYVELKVFDVRGKEVETLFEGKQNEGAYSVKWNGTNYPSGVYIYRIQTDDHSESKKMLLIR